MDGFLINNGGKGALVYGALGAVAGTMLVNLMREYDSVLQAEKV